MATTKSSIFGDYPSPLFEALSTPIGNLRRQRKADCKPKKPKPVTDEQLLAIVDELEAKIKALTNELKNGAISLRMERFEKFVWANYKLKWAAPVKRSAVGLERYTKEME